MKRENKVVHAWRNLTWHELHQLFIPVRICKACIFSMLCGSLYWVGGGDQICKFSHTFLLQKILYPLALIVGVLLSFILLFCLKIQIGIRNETDTKTLDLKTAGLI